MARIKPKRSGRGIHIPPEMSGGPGRGGPGLAARIQMEEAAHKAAAASRRRIRLVAGAFMLGFVIIGVRLIAVAAFVPPDGNGRSAVSQAGAFGRADVVDRNGVVLATSVPTYTLKAKPRSVWRPAETAERLVRILGDVDQDLLFRRLTSSATEIRLKTRVTPRQREQVLAMGLAGLYFTKSERRAYPLGRETSHIIGLVDVDNKGVSGIERSLEPEILKAARLGTDVSLSIDVRLQHIVHTELQKSMATFRAETAAGLIMDVHTGEILAMSSLPDFDPNNLSADPAANRFNVASKGVYELGSVFKVFTVAMGLNAGTITLSDGYDTSQPLHFGRFRITDYHGKKRWLSIPEILIYSSNIGAAKIARDVGIERQRSFLRELGMFQPAAVELPEVGIPLVPAHWREVNSATVAFGHGIAITPLQLANAACAIVNGGVFRQPTLLRQPAGRSVRGHRVISEKTSEEMRRIMRMVVTEGTGGHADVAGYRVGGKTGTADKSVDGHYVNGAVVSSFLAAFPINDPKYVVFVMLDDPKGTKETHGFQTAGWTAAPLAGAIIERIGPVLGVRPDFAPVIDDKKTNGGQVEVASAAPPQELGTGR